MLSLAWGTRPNLAVVGLGLRPGHLTHEARHFIESADVVLLLAAGLLAEEMVKVLNREVGILNQHYREGLDRLVTYERMVEHVVGELRQDRLVTMAIYGHPGVYCIPAHSSIQKAKELGFSAVMCPGISAEDALFADLGIDPAARGCQSYEATHLLLHQKSLDPSSWLIVWQIGVVGEPAWREGFSSPSLKLLQLKLVALYGEAHLVTIYFAHEALPMAPIVNQIHLGALAEAEFPPLSTLVIPPLLADRVDSETLEALHWRRGSTSRALSSE